MTKILRVGVIGFGFMGHIHARRNSPKNEGPARYRGSTPLVFHVTIHDLDLILWHLQQPVVSVYAHTVPVSCREAVRKALNNYGIDDSLFAILRFQDGTLVNLESSWALPEGSATRLDAYLEVLGRRGMARVECGSSGLWFCDAENTRFPDTVHWPQVRGEIAGDLKEELSSFANCVLQDRPPLASGEDGLRSLELAWAMQKSIDSGQVVAM